MDPGADAFGGTHLQIVRRWDSMRDALLAAADAADYRAECERPGVFPVLACGRLRMLKAIGDADGVPVVVLGLTEKNVALLRQGVPVEFNVRDINGGAELPSLRLAVFLGDDNRDLVRQIRQAPTVSLAEDFEVRLGPPTHGVPR